MKHATSLIASTVLALSLHGAASAAPVPALSPLTTGAPAVGTGLAGNWFKVDDNSRFSSQPYTDENGRSGPISSFDWGTGFWAASDVDASAGNAFGNVIARTTTQSAVSFANGIYNLDVSNGLYGGSWDLDHTRTLAPIVGAAQGCEGSTGLADCAQQNYAAIFSGYLYAPQAGSFDIGLFVDDAFSLSLQGADGTLMLQRETMVGSSGRDLYTLMGLTLDAGYYAIDLSYFNRLEAGVIDLMWRTDGSDTWTTIGERYLFTDVPDSVAQRGFADISSVPEPGSMLLAITALVVLTRLRHTRRR